MSTQNNREIRVSPEQKVARQVNEIFINYLSTGGNSEFLLGLCSTLSDFIRAPGLLNAQRQAQIMLEAQSNIPKNTDNAPDSSHSSR